MEILGSKNTKGNKLEYPLLNSTTKLELLSYLNKAIELELELFNSILSEDAFFLNPDPFRLPLVFYLGHNAAFYCKIFSQFNIHIYPEKYKYLIDVLGQGVDPGLKDVYPMLKVDLELKDVIDFRDTVYSNIRDWHERREFILPIIPNSLEWAYLMCIEHQKIHLETSSVIVRQLPHDSLRRPEGWPLMEWSKTCSSLRFTCIAPTKVKYGTRSGDKYFNWDNEVGLEEKLVPQFTAGNDLISNFVYLKFVLSGGYTADEFWECDGIEWRDFTNRRHPLFWIPSCDKFKEIKYRSTFEVHEFPADWPVEVNYFEAIAFINWLSKNEKVNYRLLSEAEYHVLKESHLAKTNRKYNWSLANGSPIAVDQSEVNVLGNVWEWIGNDFSGLNGFKVDPLYPNFSSPYFDCNHKMMMGGSWISTGTQISPTYRLWFRKFMQQHAGFRVVKAEN